MRLGLRLLLVALAAALCGSLAAQPTPVEGTEQVPNEYGGTFPREIRWGKDGSIMVLIPHGTFVRGLNVDKGGRPSEAPEMEITLPSFYIDKFEVTNASYGRFQAATSAPRPRPAGNPDLLKADHPVVGLPWTAANEYASWAGKVLPSEAMWEKAARGPANTLYTTGEEPPTAEVVVVNRGANGATVPVTQDTGDVSGYGVFHMSGNAQEWVADWFASAYYATSPTVDPRGPERGETRVIRGASYIKRLDETRTTMRWANPPSLFLDDIGFRTVWVPQKPSEGTPVDATPTMPPPPTDEEVLAAMLAKITPYLERGDSRLPRELMASKAFMSRGEAEVQFINFTPFALSLNFIGPDEELVFRYNEPMVPMSYRNVKLPREVNLYMVAYAPDAPRKGPINLGFIRAESQAIILIRTNMFAPVTVEKNRMEAAERTVAEQYYSDFVPVWNEMEVFNSTPDPQVVKISDVTSGPDRAEPVSEHVLDAGEGLQVTLKPGRYSFTSEYIGATEPSSEPVTLDINDKAARRLLTLAVDPNGRRMVNVITDKKPFVMIEPSEARRLGLARGKAPRR